MKRNYLKTLLLAAMLPAGFVANAEFKDFAVNLGEKGILTAEETVQNAPVSFGITVNADGTVARVAADDASALAVFNGKFHSEHGCVNSVMTIKVDGPVKIGLGTCQYGNGTATVKSGNGETALTLNSNNGTCFHGDRTNNIVYGIYGGEATTLTLNCSNYTPYISVAAADPSEISEEFTISYSFGEYGDCGQLPVDSKVKSGDIYSIPANYTMFVEGKTLKGWSDGVNTFACGESVKVTEAMNLTPVFTDNTVSLADRKEPVTLNWNFRRDRGCPTVAWEGKEAFLVTQASVNGETIDVKMNINTNPGKFNNGNHTDWAQVNNGTTLTVPSCKGAVVTMEAYNAPTTTTVDGVNIGDGSKTPSFTCMGDAGTVDIVIGDGSYYRYVQVVLPVVKTSSGGLVFDNVNGNILWTVGNEAAPTVTEGIDKAISSVSYSAGNGLKTEVATYFDKDMAKYTPSTDNAGNVEAVMIEYRLKAEPGVTFTPSSVTYDAVKVGTDGATFSYSYVLDGKESKIVDVDAATVLRNSNSNASTATLGHEIKLNVNAVSEFSVRFYISKCASKKNICISNVNINGTFNGTVKDVTKYTLTAVANPVEAAKVTVYPNSNEYEEGSSVKLTAERNFGYKFLNWTDEEGNIVSTESAFEYKITKNTSLTANLKKIATYALDYSVEGGANLYMVQPSPAPVVIDGKNMYEEGTQVTLTASSNKILTFNNWNDGTTGNELKVTMDSDKTVAAQYSAADYIVAWDFYQPGNNGRSADFASTPDNSSTTLILRNENGDIFGWLDKSTVAANGYETMKGAAVNWTSPVGANYFQTCINARDFSNISVTSDILYNYNTYPGQILEYSIDGENWNEVARVTMSKAKVVTTLKGKLGVDADHCETLFIRWIHDKSSKITGTEGEKDGLAISEIYITATPKVLDDGVAPKVVSTIPADKAEGASASGRVVINFDEKVVLTENVKATIDGMTMNVAAMGRTVTADYRNLTYSSSHEFVLAGGSVADAAGNTLMEDVTLSFTTMSRPVIAKGLYDVEVSTAEEFLAALNAANNRENKGERYRIFMHNGTYDLGNRCLTTVSGDNISIIGESMGNVVIVNHPEKEGISVTGTLLNNSANLYMQDITLKNAWNYVGTTGRAVALQDKGDKTIAKRVKLLSFQDTYYSNNSKGRFYWEDSEIHGTVDFLCGGGDVVYNRLNIVLEDRAGNVISAPNGQKKYGYVFHDCEINPANDKAHTSNNGSYTLGRPWGAGCRAQYINTRMNVIPAAHGWNEMGGNAPDVFAEHNSTDRNGNNIDLRSRKTKFDGGTQATAILTEEHLAELVIDNVMGAEDGWNPLAHTEAAPAVTNLIIENGVISWDDNDYTLLWAVMSDGEIIGFTNEPQFTIPSASTRANSPVYSIRAANEMGGLGEAYEAVESGSSTAVEGIVSEEVVSTSYFNLQGLEVSADAKGALIKVETLAGGKNRSTKIFVK